MIKLDMWTAFKDECPQNDKAIWKDATHWIYVELPHFEDSYPQFDWSNQNKGRPE